MYHNNYYIITILLYIYILCLLYYIIMKIY